MLPSCDLVLSDKPITVETERDNLYAGLVALTHGIKNHLNEILRAVQEKKGWKGILGIGAFCNKEKSCRSEVSNSENGRFAVTFSREKGRTIRANATLKKLSKLCNLSLETRARTELFGLRLPA